MSDPATAVARAVLVGVLAMAISSALWFALGSPYDVVDYASTFLMGVVVSSILSLRGDA